MTRKSFKTGTIMLAIALAIVVGWSIGVSNAYIPIIAVFIALIVKYLMRRSTKEVLADERTRHINERASAMTMAVCVPAAGIAAVILIALKKYISPDMYIAGNVLAYFTCAFMLLHQSIYSYYNRKW